MQILSLGSGCSVESAWEGVRGGAGHLVGGCRRKSRVYGGTGGPTQG